MFNNILKLAKHYEFIILAEEMLQTINTYCPQLLPPTGSLIGKGKQGEVYDLGSRVLKIQKVMDEEMANEKISELRKLQQLDLNIYPKIDYIQKLCGSEENGEFYYYYIMEKLNQAEGAEEISKILRNKIENKSIMKYYQSPYFDKALELYDRMENSGTLHIDINPGAIMEDTNGNIKLADVDSVVSN